MRAIKSVPTSSPVSGSGINIWKSPIPYLFGGLAVMLAIISMALVILVCSYRKRDSQSSSSSSEVDQEEIKSQAMSKNLETNSEPEVLVIMAGNHNPTYLAKPITSSSSIYCTCGAQTNPSSSSSTEPGSYSNLLSKSVLVHFICGALGTMV
ncbi:hypothetical protein JHK85_022924 [Glycine max]|nr:hypothetical protein JHK85_022924 [Glycine max]